MHHIRLIPSLLLNPVALTAVSLLGVVALFLAENQASSLPFAISIVACIAGLGFAATRRVGFSIYLGWSLVGIISLISLAKFKMKGFDLHFYDGYFLGRDNEVTMFMLSSYMYIILPIILVLSLCLILLVSLYRVDAKSGASRAYRTIMAICSVAIPPIMYPSEASSHPYFYYLGGHHASSFFVSLRDIKSVVADTHSLDRLANAPTQQLLDTAAICPVTAKQPDVFVILQESRLNPADFASTRSVLSRLNHRPGDAIPMEPLQVETFGGGTWISNLSLMTGLSASDFGWRSPYLTISLEGRVQGALPEIMGRCGYRTMAIIPMRRSFVNEGPFLKSIGFETIRDANDMGAGKEERRDSFYFDEAEAQIAKHRREDGRPLFLLVQTMFNHSPYRARLAPTISLPQEPLHTDEETAEYFRRLLISHDDFMAFLTRRQAQALTHPSVLLEFGDHHASVMKPMIEESAGPKAFSTLGSIAYRTYFALHGFGHVIDQPAHVSHPLDIAFLSSVLLERARLPTSASHRDLGRLRVACGGRFHACPDRQIVDLHLKRRVNSGLLNLFEPTNRSL